MLDAALRLTFGNLSTLFLLVATVTVPLHVGHALIFQDVLAVEHIHGAIEDFRGGGAVGGVGAGDLLAARRALLVVDLIELALVPLLLRATRRVLRDDEGGGVPTVAGAWRGSLGTGEPSPGPRAAWPTAVGGLVIAVVVWLLSRSTGLLVAGVIPDPAGFLLGGLVEGAARALGAPFFLVAAVLWLRGTKGVGGSAPTT